MEYIFWHSFLAIYLTIYSGTISGIYCDIVFGILSGIYSNIFSGILSGIFLWTTWHIFWHSFWHFIWHSHWDLAFGWVRQCPLRSGARGCRLAGLSPAVPTAIWTSKSFAKSMGLPPQPWHLWLPASAWRLPNLEVSCHTVPHDQQLASRPCNTCPSASASCCPEMVLAALANTFWHPALLVGGAKIGGPVGPQSDRQTFNMCAQSCPRILRVQGEVAISSPAGKSFASL